LDIGFLFGKGTAKGGGPDHGRSTICADGFGLDTVRLGGSGFVDGEVAGNSPFGTAEGVGGLRKVA